MQRFFIFLIAGIVPMLMALPTWAAAQAEDDPLQAPGWLDIRARFFGQAPLRFDDHVQVTAPATAEDSLTVPIAVKVVGDLPVKRILVFAEQNPIPRVLEMEPLQAAPQISFRMKIQQSTPVRAAALDDAGVWHVGGVWVEASGGGCTAPRASMATEEWQKLLGQVQSRAWLQSDGRSLLRVRVNHPMDTGLVDGVPAFYLENLTLTDEAGTLYLRLMIYEPVSENPVLGFLVAEHAGHTLRLTGQDNNGNRIDRELP